MSSDEAELRRAAELLNTVFDHSEPLTVESLRWYYEQNPVGRAAVGRVEQDDRRLGNYALVPQRFVDVSGQSRILGVGVDLAVSPEARGGGVFRRTVEDSYARALALGHDGILGVANANSAPRMVATLGWRALEPLPVTLVAPLGRSRGFAVFPFEEDLLSDPQFTQLQSDGLLTTTGPGFAPVWDPSMLRWRLSRPGYRYWVHLHEELLIVSSRTKVAGVVFAVILKTLGRPGFTGALSGGAVAASVARTHRTPLVIHWGRTPWVRYRGLPLPQALMPSPLSLVLHRHHEGFDEDSFELGAFEFLDFDAY